MQLFVRGLENIFTLEVTAESTVGDLKQRICQISNIDPESQLVLFESRPLIKDDDILANLGLVAYSTIDVSGKLLGGKVHGSLARAGKVRGQTPKVEKKEKRKKKTGRAKRRMQYKRRFVNVVVTGPGRRRGPNSNM
ncbi:unnamed protein product [Soboliphyme baturini]|uniref:40S ribosomal protein S30 n=1 Tax=Soboliphyme baturini TaxID=241478 RepID=A0A183I8Z4_9BILA|nr:unnamed protein product [Soboliphyme baturini]